MRPYKRRQILVGSVQYWLLAFNLLYFLATLVLFLAALFVPLMAQLERRSVSFAEQRTSAEQFLMLDTRLWPAVGILFMLMVVHSVLISHKVAGPLYRFRSVFKTVAEGNLAVRANLRKGDYLTNEADSLNEMIASVGARISAIRDQYGETDAAFAELRSAVRGGSAEGVRRTLENLGAGMERLQASLDQFRVTPESPPTPGTPQTQAAPVAQER